MTGNSRSAVTQAAVVSAEFQLMRSETSPKKVRAATASVSVVLRSGY